MSKKPYELTTVELAAAGKAAAFVAALETALLANQSSDGKHTLPQFDNVTEKISKAKKSVNG